MALQMNFKDELKSIVDNKANEEKRAEEATKTPIPDSIVDSIANSMADIFKSQLKKYVEGKVFQCDYKNTLFKKNVKTNFRYEAGKFWYMIKANSLMDPHYNYDNYYFPKDSVYFKEYDHDMIPCDLYYCNDRHLDQIFYAVKNKLEKDGISANYSRNGGVYKNELVFVAFIPCDSNGNIK